MAASEAAHSNLCFLFVCQAGALEAPSVLLAASLRRALGNTYELVAAIPAPADTWGAPSAATLGVLRALNVRLVPVANELGRDFPFLNKIACFEIPTTARTRVFLDSDILCLRGPLDEAAFAGPFAAKPADIQTFAHATAEPWQLAYRAAGVRPAELELPATVSRQYGLPYFNSGVIVAETTVPLAAAWRACCRRIREDGTVPNSQWWLDQVGLAIAVRQLDLPFACLDERFNYPAHLKPLDSAAVPPLLCHYHSPQVIAQEPTLRALVSSLGRELPSLAALLRDRGDDWADLLAEHGDTPPPANASTGGDERMAVPRDLLLAGIPGSGEGTLAELLRAAGVEVLLDDHGVREALARAPSAGPVPWEIAVLHRAAHATARQHTRGTPVIASGVPEQYLLRLSALRRALPHARAAILVRDPFATIAAWKTDGPAALRDADVAALFSGYREDPDLSHRHVAELDRIAHTASVAARRAMLWRFLAELALDHRHEATPLTHARLTAEPAATLRALLEDASAPMPSPIAPASVPAVPADALDAADHQAIAAICAQAAADLGV